jgi:hypothetical protein
VLPGAEFRDGFEYYVPANDAELAGGEPSRYTKRVEGDHLLVLDDVAIIVEDKAVALSARARGGDTRRIGNDLTGIITKAAAQAGRTRDRIQADGGLRIHGAGWLDLRHIREIHTIAVSLDDLSTVLTATTHLLDAGVLEPENIPWTVSLHDLELITELVDRPAEFLLYLRRRRNPEVTVMFKAPDELDLFLYFFERGLWVEPDPALVRAAFPFLPEPTTAERRRYRAQQPGLITSRTDPLDRWFHETRHGAAAHPAPKPAMAPSPIAPLVDELRSRGEPGWLSLGATLLSLATGAQHQFARHPEYLLDNPAQDGRGRSVTVPITGSVDRADGWLLVWATRTQGEEPAAVEARSRKYLRAKMHQLGLPRGAVLLYDASTRALIGTYYDGHVGPLDAETTAAVTGLRPASAFHERLPPRAKRRPLPGSRS